MDRDDLTHEVVEQIRRDLEQDDPTPIYEMLKYLSYDILAAYLPETE